MKLSGLSATQVRVLLWVGLGILLLMSAWPHVAADQGESSLNVVQAQAFLNGSLDIPAALHDTVSFGGRYYVPFPPFPAILVLPAVAVFGVYGTKLIILGLILALLNAWMFKRILDCLEIPRASQTWLVPAYIFGTAFWFCLLNSRYVYGFAPVVAATCLTAAILEGYDQGRGWLMGLLLAGAFLSRQMTIYAAIFLAAQLMAKYEQLPKKRLLHLLGLAMGIGVGVVAYLGFNYLRFGNPLETGYQWLDSPLFLGERMKQYGLFSWAYVPFNFVHMFLQGVHFQFSGEDANLQFQGLDVFGTSLVMASPFVLYAALAKARRPLILGAWAAIGLCLLHTLFYYNNGWIQINCQRFTLDFLPVLMVLVAYGVKERSSHQWKFLVSYAMAYNILVLVLLASPHK